MCGTRLKSQKNYIKCPNVYPSKHIHLNYLKHLCLIDKKKKKRYVSQLNILRKNRGIYVKDIEYLGILNFSQFRREPHSY